MSHSKSVRPAKVVVCGLEGAGKSSLIAALVRRAGVEPNNEAAAPGFGPIQRISVSVDVDVNSSNKNNNNNFSGNIDISFWEDSYDYPRQVGITYPCADVAVCCVPIDLLGNDEYGIVENSLTSIQYLLKREKGEKQKEVPILLVGCRSDLLRKKSESDSDHNNNNNKEDSNKKEEDSSARRSEGAYYEYSASEFAKKLVERYNLRGGHSMCSAATGEGIPELLEKIIQLVVMSSSNTTRSRLRHDLFSCCVIL